MRVPDALVLAEYADALMFVISWKDTRQRIVQEALNRLQVSRRPIIGAVLSRVDPRQVADYSYTGYAA
jgi:Mrp family chromosome partitioning ATPase